MSATYELIAPCFFGCESTASFELRRLGAGDLRVTDGRLTFRGGADLIAAANLNLRTVERVLLLLASYKAETFDDLFDGVYAIPWEELLPADAAFPVKGSSLNSKLSSVPACQSIIKKAIVKRLMHGHHTSVLPETGSEYRVQFLLRKDLCEIMLDTSGEGLHKRGYRRNAMEAPLRETLAATIVDLSRVRRDSLVEDPFCGSGTLVIEAAQKALNMAPGLQRRFAAERYSFVPPAVWAEQRRKALDEIKQDAAFEGVLVGGLPAQAVGQKDIVAVLFLVLLVAVRLIQQVKRLADAAADVPHILALDRVVGGQNGKEGAVDVAHGLRRHRIILAPQLMLGGGLGLLLAEDPLQSRLFLGGLVVGPLQGEFLAHPLHLLLERQFLIAAGLQAVPAHQHLDLGGQPDALGLAHDRHPGQTARQPDLAAGGLSARQAVGQQGHHAAPVGEQRPIGYDAEVEVHLILHPAHIA